jgi:hypothetical protein
MILKMLAFLISSILLSGGCYINLHQEDVETIQIDNNRPLYDINKLIPTDEYDSTGMAMGKVDQDEISGIGISRSCDNRLWGINDSGNGPYLYQFDRETAETRCIFFLENMENIDWEDLSTPLLSNGKPGLLIADIGNNLQNRKILTLYRFSEPACDCEQGGEISISPEYEQIDFIYPEGTNDAEALFTDEKTGDIYILSKNTSSSEVYLLPYPQDTEVVDTLIHLGSLPFPLVVAADYSSDKDILMVKTYDRIFIWENPDGRPVSKLIFDEPMIAPYNPIELQGESICISPEGYYTLSERILLWDPVLYFYRRR